jgi:hypothetical protein
MLSTSSLSVLVFHHCDKQFKGGKIYFGSWLQRLQSKVRWIHCFQPEARQNIMAERHGGAELLASWYLGSGEAACLHWQASSFSPFVPSASPAYWTVFPTFRAGLPALFALYLPTVFQRHISRSVLY